MKKILLIILFLLTTLPTPLSGSAGPQGQIVGIDNSVFVVMVDTSIEDCICIQEKENWCWAACIEMILRYNGQYVSQRNIATRVFGDSFNRTASGKQIVSAFDGWHRYSVHSYCSKRSESLIEEISSGHPLIIGIDNHAYLLTHIYCKKASNGMLHPFKAILINPASGKEEVMEWETFFSKINTVVGLNR